MVVLFDDSKYLLQAALVGWAMLLGMMFVYFMPDWFTTWKHVFIGWGTVMVMGLVGVEIIEMYKDVVKEVIR